MRLAFATRNRGTEGQFLFAECILDIGRREWRHGFEPVGVEPQVFDLLVYLLHNHDRIVSKDDLIASVWGGRLVSESTLMSRQSIEPGTMIANPVAKGVAQNNRIVVEDARFRAVMVGAGRPSMARGAFAYHDGMGRRCLGCSPCLGSGPKC